MEGGVRSGHDNGVCANRYISFKNNTVFRTDGRFRSKGNMVIYAAMVANSYLRVHDNSECVMLKSDAFANDSLCRQQALVQDPIERLDYPCKQRETGTIKCPRDSPKKFRTSKTHLASLAS